MNEPARDAAQLRAFGGVTLTSAEGADLAAGVRRRPLAVLLVLAVAGERGVSRERLVDLLWPDHGPERGRNNLSQALHALRRELGEEAVGSGGAGLRLSHRHVRSDVRGFEEALEGDDLERAVEAYSGPFADGFRVPDADGLERWIDSERARLEAACLEAARELAERASAEGRHDDAVRWWKRIAALDPVSSTGALGLMRALAASGDRAGAVRHEGVYRALVRERLDLPPDPSVVELAERLRRDPSVPGATREPLPAPGDPPPPADTPREPPPPPPEGPRDPSSLPPDAALPGTADGSSPAASVIPPSGEAARERPEDRHRPPGRRLVRVSVVAAAAGVVGALLWIAFGVGGGGSTEPAPDGSTVTLAVFPFAASGGPEIELLGTSLVGLLSASLDGAGDLATVPAPQVVQLAPSHRGVQPRHAPGLARRLGADAYVLGDVVGDGGRIRMSAALYFAADPSSPAARATVQGDLGGLFDLSDRLAAGLITDRLRRPGDRMARAAAASALTLDAVKAYLEGDHLFREGRYAEASAAFERAVRADTVFALAMFRRSVAADWAGRDSVAGLMATRALEHADRLSEHDASLVRAHVAWRAGDDDGAVRELSELASDRPEDPEAWRELGLVLAHANPLRGRSAREAIPALERALALDPDDPDALLALARLADLSGDRVRADSLLERLESAGRPPITSLRSFRAFVLGDRPGYKQTTRYLLARADAVPRRVALEAGARAGDLDALSRFAEALDEARSGSEGEAATGGAARRMRARVALARGRWGAAEAVLAPAGEPVSAAGLELLSLAASWRFLPLDRAAVLRIREEVRRWDPEREEREGRLHTEAHRGLHRHLRLHRLALLGVRLGETEVARALADSVEALGGDPEERALGSVLAGSIRAHAAFGDGRPAEALELLDGAGWRAGADVFEAEAHDRFLRAEALQALGRREEALRWYSVLGERSSLEVVFLAPAAARMAELLEAAGEPERAAVQRRRFDALWQGVDPPPTGSPPSRR